MPDSILPVGAQVKVPDPMQGINTFSGILGIRQQQQALQGQAAEVQMARQSADQRSGIADYFRNTDLSQHVGKDGTLDLDSILTDPKLRNAAGDQFPDVVGKLISAKQGQLTAKQSLATLNDDLRNQFSRSMGALRTDDDVVKDTPAGRQKVRAAMDAFAQSGGSDAERVVGNYAPLIDHIPQGNLSKALGNVQLQAQDAASQTRSQTPNNQAFDSGPTVDIRQTNPLGANYQSPPSQITKGFGPDERYQISENAQHQKILTDRVTGQVQVMQGGSVSPPAGGVANAPNSAGPAGAAGGGASPIDAGGSDIPTRPRGMPSPTAPPGRATGGATGIQDANPTAGQAAASTDIARAGAASYAENVNAASAVPTQRNVLQNIIKLADQVNTGPESDQINRIKAMVGNNVPGAQSWKDSSTAYQEMTKYMEQQALRAWGAAGGTGTNAQLEAQKHANPSNQYNPEAVKSLAQWTLAGQDAQQAKTNAMLAWAKKEGNGPANSLEFESRWANVMDPRAFQIAHMTPQEIAKTFPDRAERDEIRKHFQTLQAFIGNPQ